jgi:glycine dehydrogenase subunit 1
MSLLGEVGLRRLALLNRQAALKLKASLEDIAGLNILTPRFFNEIAVSLPVAAAPLVDALALKGIIAGVPLSRLDPEAGMDNVLLLAATETTEDSDIAALVSGLQEALA